MVNCKSGKVVNPATGRCVNKNSPVLKKMPVVKVVGPVGPFGPAGPFGPKKIIQTCGPNLYINPKTRRCVQLKNPDVQKYLKQGYVLAGPQGPQGPQGPLVPPVKLDKVPINDPKNVKDPDIKILVPPDTNNYVKLVYCGKDKVINPATGRCINLSGPLGKKLTSKPYIIVNPPGGPQKTPYFAKPPGPDGPDGPKLPIKVKTIVPKLGPLTALDKDGDNYISIREYLDAVESKGPQEKTSGWYFQYYNQRDLGISFILSLIKNQRGPIHKIGCIPLYFLCVYKSPTKTFYPMENIKYNNKFICPRSVDYYGGDKLNTYASIVIFNAPLNYSYGKNVIDKMKILIPPNLKQLITNCENDDKYMVVCDLTLLMGEKFSETSHANVLIFDIRRKTIERFDPHGGNYYSDVKLAYDPNSDHKDIIGKKDFKNLNFGDSHIKSQALYNQIIIDNQLKEKFMEILPTYRYYGTNHTTPYLGPQIKADAYDGLCVTWSCMYMVLRLLNPDLSPADITMNMINGTPKELLNRILRFQKFIIRTLSKEKKYIK